MTQDPRITVYLDTQDYSRFGKVVDGNGTSEDACTFERLKDLRAQGLARFAYSAAILSELIQYEPEFERETLAKARAVEELCGGSTLIWLPRLIETQANAFGRSIGLDLPDTRPECVQDDNMWFPRLSGQLADLKEQIRAGLGEAAANHGFLNRAQRRAVDANKREGKLIAAAKAIAPQFSEKYALPVGLVERAVLPLLRGKCTADDASQKLFSVVAKPTAFVHAYFKVQNRDASTLNFINAFGKNLEQSLTEFRRNAEPFMTSKGNVEHLRSLLGRDIGQLATVLLDMIEIDEGEQGVTAEALNNIRQQPDALANIPACAIASQIMLGYLEQTVAAEKPSRIERGFGGDLMHVLYIDCVDIWRGDGRFAELVRQRLRGRAHKIQPRLHAVPEQIIRLADRRN